MFEGKNNRKAWLYLAPVLIMLAIFSFYPIIKTFIIAFIRDYYPVRSTFAQNVAKNRELGLSILTLKNFGTVIKNPLFGYSIKNTLLIAFISVPISLLLSLVVSVLLVSIKPLRGFFQTLFFLPYVTSSMAVAMAFTVLFANPGDAKNGYNPSPVNTVVQALGLEEPLMDFFDMKEWKRNGKEQWLLYTFEFEDGTKDLESAQKEYDRYKKIHKNDDEYGSVEAYIAAREADLDYKYQLEHNFRNLGRIDWMSTNSTYDTCIFIVLLYSIWGGMAFKILVFTGGLTGIDKQYYDAAKIDGTSKWRTFWRITVPMVSPLIVYLLTTSFIGSFKTYTSIVGLFGETLGPKGPNEGNMTTFVGLVYKYLKNGGNDLMGEASAAALILFVIIFVITKILNKLTEKRVHY